MKNYLDVKKNVGAGKARALSLSLDRSIVARMETPVGLVLSLSLTLSFAYQTSGQRRGGTEENL